MKFLSQQHQDWVRLSPDNALEYARSCQGRGEFLVAQNRHSEALSYLGSAFEACGLLFQGDQSPTAELGRLYTTSALTLNQCLVSLGMNEKAFEVRESCQQQLDCLMWSYLEKPIPLWLANCLNQMPEKGVERKAIQRCAPSLATPARYIQ